MSTARGHAELPTVSSLDCVKNGRKTMPMTSAVRYARDFSRLLLHCGRHQTTCGRSPHRPAHRTRWAISAKAATFYTTLDDAFVGAPLSPNSAWRLYRTAHD